MTARVSTVRVVSKPEAVPALRAAWRASAEHAAEQAWRFVRLFAVALVPQLLGQISAGASISGHSLRILLVSVAVPTAEVVWRQLHPALTASAVDTAPGATLVPAELPAPGGAPDGGAPPVQPGRQGAAGGEGDAAP